MAFYEPEPDAGNADVPAAGGSGGTGKPNHGAKERTLCVWWSSQTQFDEHTRTADDDAVQGASATAAGAAASALGAAAVVAAIEHEEAAQSAHVPASAAAPIAAAIEPTEGSGKRKRDQQEEQEGADEEPAAVKGAAPVGRKPSQCAICPVDQRKRICEYKEGADPRCGR